jgi:hypothetical protein
VTRCVQFVSKARNKRSLTDIVGLMPQGHFVSGFVRLLDEPAHTRPYPLRRKTLTKQSHVDPKPFPRRQSRRHCLLLQAFTASHQQCVDILSRYFLPQGQKPHGRVVTFHRRQNFGCRRRTTHALDCSRFPKDPRGHRVSSLVRQASDSTTLTLPVVQIAEGTVMRHR